jgi:hypothetical protein
VDYTYAVEYSQTFFEVPFEPMSVLQKGFFEKWLTLLQMKLHGINVDDNVKWYARLNCWPNPQYRTEFVNSYFPNYVFDLFSVYVSLLHLCHKLFRGNALFQNGAEISLTNILNGHLYFDMMVENFDINAKLSNSNSVLSYHSAVANVEQVHRESGDWSFRHSDYAMETKIFRCQFIHCPLCSSSLHELPVNTCRLRTWFRFKLRVRLKEDGWLVR